MLHLSSSDHHQFSSFIAQPVGKPKAAVVIIQEIFGVNAHIRGLCDQYSKEGFIALAPALFDRIQPGIELAYSDEDRRRGIDLAFKQLTIEQALTDIQAAINYFADEYEVAVVGYCFGGLLTWLAACELDRLAAATAYYGGGLVRYKDCQPHCPVQLHFGRKDQQIPLADVESIRLARPAVDIHLYDAGHGFNRHETEAFHADSAALAFARTKSFFAKHLSF